MTATPATSYSVQVSNGDIAFDSMGRAAVVQGWAKASQDLGEQLLSDLRVQDGTGATLVSYNGPIGSTQEGLLTAAIQDAVRRLIAVQRSNGVPPNEQIANIQQLWVKSNPDGTAYFYLRVVTVGGDTVVRQSTYTPTKINQTGVPEEFKQLISALSGNGRHDEST